MLSIENSRSYFTDLCQKNFVLLDASEVLKVELTGEESEFCRLNNGKIRQNTYVFDLGVGLSLQKENKQVDFSFTLCGDDEKDFQKMQKGLFLMRGKMDLLPEDPFFVAFENHGESIDDSGVKSVSADTILSEVLPIVDDVEFTGILTTGYVLKANFNSLGQAHWYKTASFYLDYSLFNKALRAVKGMHAGRNWDSETFKNKLLENKKQLELLDRPVKEVSKGKYRVYLAPAALADIVGILSWAGLSEAAYHQGANGLQKLRKENLKLSSLFSIRENFELGLGESFNASGEMSPKQVSVIKNGELVQYLTSSKTAKEYGVETNYASESESFRSAEILPGELAETDVLKELDTGLYISNVHYLNWSDRNGGRITGMTRYACFWVEGGELVAPISDLRFDESLYDCFGSNLIALTKESEVSPSTSTYFHRELGGVKTPGALIEDFTFTL